MGSVRARARMVSNSASAARHPRRATWHRPNLYLSVASSTWGWARGSGLDAAGAPAARGGDGRARGAGRGGRSGRRAGSGDRGGDDGDGGQAVELKGLTIEMHRATVLALAEQRVRVQRDVRGALAGRGGVGRVVRAGEETAEERGAVPQLVRNQSLDLRAEMSRRRHRARAIRLARAVLPRFARDATLCPRAIAASQRRHYSRSRETQPATVGFRIDEDDSVARFPREFRHGLSQTPPRGRRHWRSHQPGASHAAKEGKEEDIIVGVVLGERRGRACSAQALSDPVHVRQAPAVLLDAGERCRAPLTRSCAGR